MPRSQRYLATGVAWRRQRRKEDYGSDRYALLNCRLNELQEEQQRGNVLTFAPTPDVRLTRAAIKANVDFFVTTPEGAHYEIISFGALNQYSHSVRCVIIQLWKYYGTLPLHLRIAKKDPQTGTLKTSLGRIIEPVT